VEEAVVNRWRAEALRELDAVFQGLSSIEEKGMVQALMLKVRDVRPKAEDFADLLFMLMQCSDRIPRLKRLYAETTELTKQLFIYR
jgi:hypothetical protein